jgi:hypothetical protein
MLCLILRAFSYNVRFEVITRATVKTMTFRKMKPCSLVDGHQNFGGMLVLYTKLYGLI